jgi:hypothetical protein
LGAPESKAVAEILRTMKPGGASDVRGLTAVNNRERFQASMCVSPLVSGFSNRRDIVGTTRGERYWFRPFLRPLSLIAPKWNIQQPGTASTATPLSSIEMAARSAQQLTHREEASVVGWLCYATCRARDIAEQTLARIRAHGKG